MQYAWEYALKAAQNLDAQGQQVFSPQQILEEAVRLGWRGERHTVRHHVSADMWEGRAPSRRPYFERVGHGLYQLNDAGRRAAQGM